MLHNSRRSAQIKASKPPDPVADHNLLVDSLRNEIGVLSRKLGSKTEALSIMTRELDQCRLDRDQFRAMLEQLRGSHSSKAAGSPWSLVTSDAGLRHQLATSRQQCAQLEQMVSDLSQKMEEVCGDMMVLRRDAVRERHAIERAPYNETEHKQQIVDKMELLQSQCDVLRRDLEQVLDEKEELVTQRDAYKGKAHRLNHQLQMALGAPAGGGLDVDSLVTENRHLQEQLLSSQEEIGRLTRVCTKYKTLVEARKNKGILRLGTPDSSALIVTKRQVEEMLRTSGSGGGELSDTPATLSDLRSLCAALLEQLQDKCTALSHQRKANRLLAEHCSQLRLLAARHRLPVQPSADLMRGYSATNLDRESEQILREVETGGDVPPSPATDVQPCPPSADGHLSPLSTDAHPSPPSTDGQPSPPGTGARPSPPNTDRRRLPPATGGRQTDSFDSSSGCSGDAGSACGAARPRRADSSSADEEIVSIQQLDRYVRCLRQDANSRPARVVADSHQPDVQVLGSPKRAAVAAAPAARRDSAELPAELDSLYRRALDELRAGEQTT